MPGGGHRGIRLRHRPQQERASRTTSTPPTELEATLSQERGKKRELQQTQDAAIKPGNAIFTRQQRPLGLGHAVWCARDWIGREPFAVLLPDELTIDTPSCTAQLGGARTARPAAMSSPSWTCRASRPRATASPPVKAEKNGLAEITGLVEKPKPEGAPSTLAIIGRYVLMPEVFDHLDKHETGAGGEIQLTDAMAKMIGNKPFHALTLCRPALRLRHPPGLPRGQQRRSRLQPRRH